MQKLAFVQTSQTRRAELERFIDSLIRQKGIDFSDLQYIFVDQGDHRECFVNLPSEIHFCYLQSDPCSLSKARNIGLRQVTSEYVCFPDDDCWYEPDTLRKVLACLTEPGVDGIVGKGTDEQGKPTNAFGKVPAKVTKFRRQGTISYTLFVRFMPDLFFDEHIGVGTTYGLNSGEETDYLLNLLEQYRLNIEYHPEIIVHHPSLQKLSGKHALEKIYTYARGAGYLMKKHRFPVGYVLKELSRPLCGALVYGMSFRFLRANCSFHTFRGRLEGWRFNEKKFEDGKL